MSKRTARREAERQARKLAFQNLRQQKAQQPAQSVPGVTESVAEGTVHATEPAVEPPTEDPSDLLARAQAFFETTPTPESPNTETTSISEAQLAANRANSQHSTGPVTPEGRAKSSLNALKHALTGKTVLLPHEDAAQYQRELQDYIAIYQPANDEELRLVQSQNNCVWRIDRIQRLESAILLKGHIEFAGKYEDRTAHERAHLIEAEAYLKYEKQLRNLNLQESRLRRIMEKDRTELLRLQAVRRRDELAAQTQTKPSQTARPAAQPPNSANGFEFSTQQNSHDRNRPQSKTGGATSGRKR